MAKILIIDEYGFARICSAILNRKGYETDMSNQADTLPPFFDQSDFKLVITSYPFAVPLFSWLKEKKIPLIVLSDRLDDKLMNTLDGHQKTYCMVKPIDFEKFGNLVKTVVEGNASACRGYRLV